MATNIKMRVPDDLEAGVYANLLGVWHSLHEFTFDFAVMLPVEDDGSGDVTVPARVVARIKVPTNIVFDIIKAINENLTGYEANFGMIRKVGDSQPMLIPDDLLDEQGDEDD